MLFVREGNALRYRDENGKVLAEISWRVVNEALIDVNHTYVDESLRGQGIAAQLLDALVAEATEAGWKIHASCVYVVRQFARSPRYDAVKADG